MKIDIFFTFGVKIINTMQPTLLILAAGMGSRYGGLKQIDQIGPSGEAIIDYSIYDAIRAGFGRVVFVIRKSIEEPFKAAFVDKFSDKIKVDYVFQELDMLPEGFTLPEEREKPWGTAHAMLVAKDAIKEPFAVINADDYYGKEAYQDIVDFLKNVAPQEQKHCMVGYYLKSTLSENGTVNRGVCSTDENSNLTGIVETIAIEPKENGIFYPAGTGTWNELSPDTIVSMNMFGFTPAIFTILENDFKQFLTEKINAPKSEFFIPLAINKMIQEKTGSMKVLKSEAEWFGVTYKEDKPVVIERINELVVKGVYPEKLW
jgi:UTP-glucose-1-phosphate uridylyltransferase